MMKKLLLTLTALFVILALFTAGCGGTQTETDKTTISIGKVPYPHEWMSAHIIQQVAEELGYEVKIVEGDMGFMFLGLSQGDIDIFPDVWLPTLHKTYVDKYKNNMELTGTVFEDVAMGLAVPSYVDIDSIAELKGRGEEFDNRIVGIEPSAGIMLTAEETVEAYGLGDEYELLEGSTPAMLAEVEQAVANEQPVIFTAWRPHTMFMNYDLKILDDPEGIWIFDDALTGVSKDLKDRAPDLYEFTQNYKISIDELEAALVKIENEDKDVEQLAKEWIEQNRDKVDQMLGK